MNWIDCRHNGMSGGWITYCGGLLTARDLRYVLSCYAPGSTRSEFDFDDSHVQILLTSTEAILLVYCQRAGERAFRTRSDFLLFEMTISVDCPYC